MPHYLVRGRYTSEGWAALVKNPHDRTVAMRPLIESVGGRYREGWFSQDLSQIIGIIEFPDDATMARVAAAVRSSGAVADVSCEKLISSADAVALFQQAGEVDYQPPA